LKAGINSASADDFANLVEVVHNLAGYAVKREASPEEPILLQSSALAACDALDIGVTPKLALSAVFV
jgi:hypothetical protein